MNTKPVTFYVNDWAIQAAIVHLHSNGTPISRITISRIRETVTEWYETHGYAMACMGPDDLPGEWPEEDDPVWSKAWDRGIRLGLIEAGA